MAITPTIQLALTTSLASKYYCGPLLLNSSNQMGTGESNMTLPLVPFSKDFSSQQTHHSCSSSMCFHIMYKTAAQMRLKMIKRLINSDDDKHYVLCLYYT